MPPPGVGVPGGGSGQSSGPGTAAWLEWEQPGARAAGAEWPKGTGADGLPVTGPPGLCGTWLLRVRRETDGGLRAGE